MALPVSTLVLVLPLSVLARYPDDPTDTDDDTQRHPSAMGSRSTRRTITTFFMFGIGFFMAMICCAYVCIPFLRDKAREETRARQRVESAPSIIECGSFDGSGAASSDAYDMGVNDAAMARADEPE